MVRILPQLHRATCRHNTQPNRHNYGSYNADLHRNRTLTNVEADCSNDPMREETNSVILNWLDRRDSGVECYRWHLASLGPNCVVVLEIFGKNTQRHLRPITLGSCLMPRYPILQVHGKTPPRQIVRCGVSNAGLGIACHMGVSPMEGFEYSVSR